MGQEENDTDDNHSALDKVQKAMQTRKFVATSPTWPLLQPPRTARWRSLTVTQNIESAIPYSPFQARKRWTVLNLTSISVDIRAGLLAREAKLLHNLPGVDLTFPPRNQLYIAISVLGLGFIHLWLLPIIMLLQHSGLHYRLLLEPGEN